jgi:MoxR-like ATPase
MSQLMKTAAALGLFALCVSPLTANDFAAERSIPQVGLQIKALTTAPKIDLLAPGAVGLDPLAAGLHETLALSGTLSAAPGAGTLNVASQLSEGGAKLVGPEVGTPAATPQARLAEIQKTVDGLPDLGKSDAAGAANSGARLNDAVTGEKSAGSGAVATNDETPEAPLKERVAKGKAVLDGVRAEVGKVIIGQRTMVDAIIMAMVADQHVLLEGLPGVGKTETAKAFADAVTGDFQRVQGTPDKLPSDILGSEILQEDPASGKKSFELSKGPIFTNILLVDEINRMPPKAQSALLEAMAEKRTTIGRQTLGLPRFTVMATQNPVEQDGTYRLPEAQLDRFMFKILVPQPNAQELKVIMERNRSKDARPKASKVTSLEQLDEIRRTAESIPMDKDIEDYIVKIVMAAKEHEHLKGNVEYSVYTRAAIFMAQASRIHALMQGRDWVSPEDVRAVAPLVMRHRIVLNYQAGTNPDQLIAKILDLVAPPKPVVRPTIKK